MKVIRGKKALVTGAASGIGRAIAGALAREGADLYLVDIDQDGLHETANAAAAAGVQVKSAVCDLSQPDAVRALLETVKSDWGRLNILVNNAGLAHYGGTLSISDEQWDRVMAVNFAAPIQIARDLLPLLLREDEAHIVNVCSIFGLVTRRKIAAYQTSKFGLVGFSLALRTEFTSATFGVTALCPGFVKTPMIDQLTAKREKLVPAIPSFICTTPERVAAKAIAAIYANRGVVVITPLARLFWGVMRLSPGLVVWVARQGWKSPGRK